MLELLLESKYCRQDAYYLEYVATQEVTVDNYLDYATLFRVGYVTASIAKEFNVARIQTTSNSLLIHAYRNLPFKTKDKIMIDSKVYSIVNVDVSFEERGNKIVKHYYINIK